MCPIVYGALMVTPEAINGLLAKFCDKHSVSKKETLGTESNNSKESLGLMGLFCSAKPAK